MYQKVGFQAKDLGDVCELDHEQWSLFSAAPDAVGIKESGLLTRAKAVMKHFGDQDDAYAVHDVYEAKNALIGDRLKNPSIFYPDSPTKLRKAVRPRRADANPGLVNFRDEARDKYNEMVTTKSSYKKWTREMRDKALNSFHIVKGEFPNALANIGRNWTVEGIRETHHINENDAQKVISLLGKMHYLLWEAIIMVVGEATFVAASPLEVFGHFAAQIKMQEAAYIYIWPCVMSSPMLTLRSLSPGSPPPSCSRHASAPCAER